MGLLESLQHTFEQRFGHPASHVYHSPGRVNIIGEHIDYNGGPVLPTTLDFGIHLLLRARADRIFNIHSLQQSPSVRFSWPLTVDAQALRAADTQWFHYLQGVLLLIEDRLPDGLTHGFDILLSSALPTGAGLSSSAALTTVSALALLDAHDQNIDRVELARLSQRVENQVIGVDCGIMDPFSIALGQANAAILLDCHSLEYEVLPLEFDDLCLVVLDSHKSRALASSQYNLRRSECQQALEVLRQQHPQAALKQLADAQLEQLSALQQQPKLWRRAHHVVTEVRRVGQLVTQLRNRQAQDIGPLLNESHSSLRDDYEVSCQELDILVDAAQKHPACLGARMTGAGFGGCAVGLIEEAGLDDFTNTVAPHYLAQTGLALGVHKARPGPGTCRIWPPAPSP